MAEEDRDETAEGRGLRETIGSAREAFGSSLDKVSGTAYRRQFEQFTNIVETTIVGIHRDQRELHKRVEKVERSPPVMQSAPPTQKLIVVVIVFSLIAATLALASLVVPL